MRPRRAHVERNELCLPSIRGELERGALDDPHVLHAFRKMTLTAHVSFSVGWLGTVVAFLALAVVGLTSTAPDVVRSAYVATNVLGLFVIVPASIGALVTGIAKSLITPWGLVRHYWVAAKLSLTVAATALLFLHQFTVVAEAARRAFARTRRTIGVGVIVVVAVIAAIVHLLKAGVHAP